MSDDHRRARRRGRSLEVIVAKAFDGWRPRGGNRGMASSDIEGTPYSIECTRTKNETESGFRKKWAQACRNAALEGRPPLLIYARPGQPLAKALLMCHVGVVLDLLAEIKSLKEGADG